MKRMLVPKLGSVGLRFEILTLFLAIKYSARDSQMLVARQRLSHVVQLALHPDQFTRAGAMGRLAFYVRDKRSAWDVAWHDDLLASLRALKVADPVHLATAVEALILGMWYRKAVSEGLTWQYAIDVVEQFINAQLGVPGILA
ncbi:MAG: hypothetical protein U1E46_12850 [Hyphomicrobiales bacterium]